MNLRQCRKAAKITQAEAGAAIGKNQSHYGKIERNEVTLTAIDAVTLANLFRCSLDSLLREKQPAPTWRKQRSQK